jgi:hypothetical protein
VISFSRKTGGIHFIYFNNDILIVRTERVKDLGIMFDSRLHFYRHIDYLHSKALMLLGLIRFVTYNVYSLDGLILHYFNRFIA